MSNRKPDQHHFMKAINGHDEVQKEYAKFITYQEENTANVYPDLQVIKKFTKDLIKETTKVQDILCPKKVQPKISYLRKKPKVPDVCVIEIISDSSIEVVKEKKSTIA